MDRFTLTCSCIDGPRVLAFRGTEGLGECFDYQVFFTVDEDVSLNLEAESVLGAPAALTIGAPGDGTEIYGYVAELELIDDIPHSVFRVRLTPELWFLQHSNHSRVFVDKPFPEVLRQVLEHNGLTFQLRLGGDYPARKHLCQYDESDLAFLERWMEREGIYYFFDHTQPQSPLIICDAPSHHQPVSDDPIAYHPFDEVDVSSREAFRSFRAGTHVLTKQVTAYDYNYMTPALEPSASADVAGELAVDTHLWAEDEPDDTRLSRVARLRAERHLAQRNTFHASGTPLAVHAGCCFALEDHPAAGLNQDYLAVRLVRRAQLHTQTADTFAYFDEKDRECLGTDQHLVEVEAIVSDVQYRSPARTPWPRASGMELAWVDGPDSSPYSQIDEEGRYLVRLMLDEADTEPGQASTRLRHAQPHAGSPEGWHLPLRKGTEVLVTFVGGNPDRPLIAGAIPNAITPSPVTDSNHTKNVVQTGGRNRLEIEDLTGQEYLDISTPPLNTYVHLGAHGGLGDHNIVLSTDGDGLIYTKGNRDITVDTDQNESVKGNVTEHYHADQGTHVASAFSEAIDSGSTQTIHSGLEQTITGGLNQTIDGGETRTVSGGVTETVNGSREQGITGSSTETITGALTQTIDGGAGVSITGTCNITAAGGIKITSDGPVNITANGSFLLNAAGGQTCLDETKGQVATKEQQIYAIKAMISATAISLTNISIGLIGCRTDQIGAKGEVMGAVASNSGWKSAQTVLETRYQGLIAWFQGIKIKS